MITPDEDDGITIREPYYNEEDLKHLDKDDLQDNPGLKICLAISEKHDIILREFGDDSLYPKKVEIYEENIPIVVEEIAKRAREDDRQEILNRVLEALEIGEERED